MNAKAALFTTYRLLVESPSVPLSFFTTHRERKGSALYYCRLVAESPSLPLSFFTLPVLLTVNAKAALFTTTSSSESESPSLLLSLLLTGNATTQAHPKP